MDRNIQYYKNYFIDFYNTLDCATQRKIAYVIQYIKTESRCILDDGNIVILFNGFQKKTQKTPKQEIDKAIQLKNHYYAEKQ